MARNAILTTRNRQGSVVETNLVLENISQDLSLEMESTQLHKGIAHKPVRVQERFLDFTVLYSVRNEAQMNRLAEIIRDHHFYVLEQNEYEPMVLQHLARNRTYTGLIEDTDKGVERFTALYRRSYRMRLITDETTLWSLVTQGAKYTPIRDDNRLGWLPFSRLDDAHDVDAGKRDDS